MSFDHDTSSRRTPGGPHRSSTAWAVALLCLTLGSPTALGAQSRDDGPSVEVLGRLAELEAGPDDGLLGALLRPARCEAGPSPSEARARALEAEADALGSNLAIDFEASLQGSRGGGTDEGFGISTEGGTYTGLSWNLLSSGLLENRTESKLLETRAEIARREGRRRQTALEVQCLVRSFERRFLPLRQRLARLARATLTGLQDLKRDAYFQGVIGLDELLATERELERVDHRISYLSHVDDVDRRTEEAIERFPPIVRLDVDGLIARMERRGSTNALAELDAEETRLSNRVSAATRLRVFVRYEMDEGIWTGQGASAGFRFSWPIFGTDAGAGEEETVEYHRRNRRRQTYTRRADVRAMRRDVQEQMSAAIRDHYRYLSAYERARRTLAALRVGAGEARVAEASQRVQDLLHAADERTQTVQRLYERIGRAFAAAALPVDTALLERVDLPGVGYRHREGERTMYVWPETRRRESVATLLEFARAKGIDRITLASSASGPDAPARELAAGARDQGIGIEYLLSADAWLRTRNHDAALRAVRGLPAGSDVHLHVQPQRLSGYRGGLDEELGADHHRLVQKVAEALGPDRDLALSVPLGGPTTPYEQLADEADRFYVMAYGRMPTSQRIERVRRITDRLPAGKVVVVVRAHDFDGEADLERELRALKATLDLDRFALHGASAYLDLMRGAR